MIQNENILQLPFLEVFSVESPAETPGISFSWNRNFLFILIFKDTFLISWTITTNASLFPPLLIHF